MTREFKRWYDHDPLLLDVINMLKDYKDELHEQAEVFLKSIESKVSKETIERFYQTVKPINGGKRWYDDDIVISRTVELLRIVPMDIQKKTAQSFIETLKANGIELNS